MQNLEESILIILRQNFKPMAAANICDVLGQRDKRSRSKVNKALWAMMRSGLLHRSGSLPHPKSVQNVTTIKNVHTMHTIKLWHALATHKFAGVHDGMHRVALAMYGVHGMHGVYTRHGMHETTTGGGG